MFRGEIPEMNNILDRDDFSIMKRAIYATQVPGLGWLAVRKKRANMLSHCSHGYFGCTHWQRRHGEIRGIDTGAVIDSQRKVIAAKYTVCKTRFPICKRVRLV